MKEQTTGKPLPAPVEEGPRSDRIINITPEIERRVLQERRQEPRERIADMEQRLDRIAFLTGPPYDAETTPAELLRHIYALATTKGKLV
jgi:hypothetical protein